MLRLSRVLQSKYRRTNAGGGSWSSTSGISAAAAATGAIGTIFLVQSSDQQVKTTKAESKAALKTTTLVRNNAIPSRANQISELSAPDKVFDVLVIGGGATGAGAALDAATRGLSTALIERGDFGNETSSRST